MAIKSFRFAHARFLSTLSLRRATGWFCGTHRSCSISIHALLAESDAQQLGVSQATVDFYPRSPCGERRLDGEWKDVAAYISIHALLAESDDETMAKLSGLSVISIHALLAESDWPTGVTAQDVKISIHALLAESDRCVQLRRGSANNFYPRSPCGERHGRLSVKRYRLNISIHALLAESDVLQKAEKITHF